VPDAPSLRHPAHTAPRKPQPRAQALPRQEPAPDAQDAADAKPSVRPRVVMENQWSCFSFPHSPPLLPLPIDERHQWRLETADHTSLSSAPSPYKIQDSLPLFLPELLSPFSLPELAPLSHTPCSPTPSPEFVHAVAVLPAVRGARRSSCSPSTSPGRTPYPAPYSTNHSPSPSSFPARDEPKVEDNPKY
jgi:hypothetical protein